MRRFRFASVIYMTLLAVGVLFSYGCQKSTMPVGGEVQTTLSVEPEELFEVIRGHVTDNGEMLIFTNMEDDSFERAEREDGLDLFAARGELGGKIKFGQLIGEDAKDMWGGWVIGAALNKRPEDPDCRVSVDTSIGDDAERAFAACWIGVMQDCREGALLIQKDDEYHVYSNCD